MMMPSSAVADGCGSRGAVRNAGFAWLRFACAAACVLACAFALPRYAYAQPPAVDDIILGKEPVARWSGLYFGLNGGNLSGRAKFDLMDYPSGSLGNIIPPVPPHTTAHNQSFIGGAQYGYNYQLGSLVTGFEQDFLMMPRGAGLDTAYVHSTGTVPGIGPFDMYQTQQVEWLTTLRGRLGWTLGDRTMVYGTGGVAAASVKTTTQLGTAFIGDSRDYRVGWAAGVGAEYAMTENLSITAEYLRVNLRGAVNVAVPTFATSSEIHDRAGYSADIFRAAINYKFNANEQRFDPKSETFFSAPRFDNFQIEMGSRYWYSTGKTAKNLYGLSGSDLVSRLTYSDTVAHSGEIFARLDHRSGVFVKGFAGTGAITGGKLKDEDFPPGISPYSATTSDQKDGSLLYVSGDVGYNILRSPTYRVGPFVGLHYAHEVVNARGCAQIATNPTVCGTVIPNDILAITEDSKWTSARVGVSSEFLWDRIKLSLEGAWLPSVSLESHDTHWLRIQPVGGNFIGPIPEDGTGTGMQFEGVVSYLVNDAFSVGVGARYWRMETTSGGAHFESNIYGGGGTTQPVTFVTERYGGFLQGAYRF
jgi:opacity protein-like surface antigen/outer membrane protease